MTVDADTPQATNMGPNPTAARLLYCALCRGWRAAGCDDPDAESAARWSCLDCGETIACDYCGAPWTFAHVPALCRG